MSKVFNMVGGGGGKNISSIIITGLESTDTIDCTKDGKSYTATWDSTAQHWEIVGLPLGTFTVTATNGTKTKTKTVLIDITGVYEIEMYYNLWLYRDGDECEDVTGGWTSQLVTGKGSVAKNVDNITITTVADGNPNAAIVTANKIKQAVFSRYAKLCISYSETCDNHCRFGLSTVTGNDPAMVVSTKLSSNATYAELDLTSTTIAEDCYVVVTAWGNAPNVNTVVVKQFWLER